MSRWDAILLAAALLVAADAEAADAGRREKPLVLPAIEATGLVAVRLDADVHAAAADGYGDLRILDAKGDEIPHVVRDMLTTNRGKVERRARAVVAEAKPLPDGSLEVTVALGDGHEARF